MTRRRRNRKRPSLVDHYPRNNENCSCDDDADCPCCHCYYQYYEGGDNETDFVVGDEMTEILICTKVEDIPAVCPWMAMTSQFASYTASLNPAVACVPPPPQRTPRRMSGVLTSSATPLTRSPTPSSNAASTSSTTSTSLTLTLTITSSAATTSSGGSRTSSTTSPSLGIFIQPPMRIVRQHQVQQQPHDRRRRCSSILVDLPSSSSCSMADYKYDPIININNNGSEDIDTTLLLLDDLAHPSPAVEPICYRRRSSNSTRIEAEDEASSSPPPGDLPLLPSSKSKRRKSVEVTAAADASSATATATTTVAQPPPPFLKMEQREQLEEAPIAAIATMGGGAAASNSNAASNAAAGGATETAGEHQEATPNGGTSASSKKNAGGGGGGGGEADDDRKVEGEGGKEAPKPSPSDGIAFESPEQRSLVLSQLARQLEYYFSDQNLSRDTYLQTLRNLNDGFVPASILANFAKVRAILGSLSPPDHRHAETDGGSEERKRANAVLEAATPEFTDLLAAAEIDAGTGKRVPAACSSSSDGEAGGGAKAAPAKKTIPAVGVAAEDGKPLQLSDETVKRTMSVTSLVSMGVTPAPLTPQTPCGVVLSPGGGSSSNVNKTSNTVIFRELAPDVEEGEVRALFDFDGCPAIQAVYADVACCWFVVLDTESRDDMMRVMMHVRAQTIRGEYVQARLKASSISIPDTAPPPLPALLFPYGGAGASKKQQQRRRNRSKNKKKASKKKESGGSGNNNNNGSSGNSEKNNSPAVGGKQDSQQRQKQQNGSKAKKSSSNSSKNNSSSNSNSKNSEQAKTKKPSTPRRSKNFAADMPSFGEDDFPTLQGDKKVEWDINQVEEETQAGKTGGDGGGGGSKGPDDFDDDLKASTKSVSDAASTVTASSSSVDSRSCKSNTTKTLGGYAAALLNPSPAAAAAKKIASAPGTASQQQAFAAPLPPRPSSPIAPGAADGSGKKAESQEGKEEEASAPIVVKPPTWGRSFADILRL